MYRFLILASALLVNGCQAGIYLRDGLTDGDVFYLSPRALNDDDPVVASWVRFSLVRSACKLDAGSTNPARVSTYRCELMARRHLADAWREQDPQARSQGDAYLDELVDVQDAGFLREYTTHYFGDDRWQVPADLDVDAFSRWRRRHLVGHRPETRLVGYWGFRQIAGERP